MIGWILSAILLTNCIEYTHLADPVSIHLLEINPSQAIIKAATANDGQGGVELLSQIATRKNATAGINGGFFRMAEKYEGFFSGILKVENEWYSTPMKERGAIGWKDHGAFARIDRLSMQIDLVYRHGSYRIDGVNQPLMPGHLILYRLPFYNQALRGEPYISIQEWMLCHLSRIFIPEPDEYTHLDFRVHPLLDPGSEDSWNEMENIVGGTPVLVYNGKAIEDFSAEKTLTSFLVLPYARTAVGLKENRNWLIAVTDRMTMYDLATFMRDQGCLYALNLDGGGSSALFFNGKIVNDPNDGEGERPISNAILIFEQ